MSKKRSNKKSYENSTPVFRIKPDGSNTAIIKYVGVLNENEKLGDEVVDLEKPLHPDHELVGKAALPLKTIGDFDMIGRIFRCNIVGAHVVISNRYPVLYLNVGYDRPMVTGSLLQIFYSIDINKDEKKLIKDNKYYVDLRFTGSWYRHIDCDEELQQNYEKMISEMLESEAVEKIYKSKDPNVIESITVMTEEQIIELIEKYVATEKIHYDSLIKEQMIEFKSLNRLRDDLIKISQDERFNKFLKIAMKCRELHRKKEHGVSEDDTDYVVPQNIVKLTDIAQKMIDDGELSMEADV